MNELIYTEGDVRFAVATAKSEIERLNKALDFWKNGHMEMTKELSDVRRANDAAVDEYIKSEEKVIALTAERDELQAALDGAKLFEQSHKHALTVIERLTAENAKLKAEVASNQVGFTKVSTYEPGSRGRFSI